ncbi:universal stress protein [Planctomycetota bacterium]|nr:universal stress protein [Planctomycetota bacterium]
METIQKIVTGVGLHPRTGVPDVGSVRAARQAAWLASRTGAQVTLLHAAWAEDGSGPVELAVKATEELEQLRELVEADGASASIRIAEDYPWLALCRAAIDDGAELVLAGKRSVADRGRRQIGSTAVKLLRKCPAPVWLVNPDHDLNHRHVLACTDFSPVSDDLLSASAWLAAQSAGELHMLHAWNLTWAEQRAAADLSEDDYAARVVVIREEPARALNGHHRAAGPRHRGGSLGARHPAADTDLGVLVERCLDPGAGPEAEEQARAEDQPVDGVEEHGRYRVVAGLLL